MDRWTTIIEPFRIHAVEPIRMTSRAERAEAAERAGYNLFDVHADDVLIDLLTDSGTGAMSRDQWAAIQHGDESYAGSPSWYTFLDGVRELFPFRHVIPTHQGRAAEKILFSVIGGPGKVIPNNTHFDTTRANVEATGAEALDLVIEAGREPSTVHPFKGNMDVAALERLLDERAADVPVVFVTITNNSGGGQPVSLENLRAVRAVCDRFGVPLFLDACRFAAQGLREVVDEDYLRYRIRSTAYLGDALDAAGIPTVRPVGGHAVYLDARSLLPHIPPLEYPGQSLAVALYVEGGIRGCEIGTVMFGRHPDGSETEAPMDLVRLAIPRRTYTQSHIDYVIEVVRAVAARASELRGYRIVSEPPALRHFTARFEPC